MVYTRLSGWGCYATCGLSKQRGCTLAYRVTVVARRLGDQYNHVLHLCTKVESCRTSLYFVFLDFSASGSVISLRVCSYYLVHGYLDPILLSLILLEFRYSSTSILNVILYVDRTIMVMSKPNMPHRRTQITLNVHSRTPIHRHWISGYVLICIVLWKNYSFETTVSDNLSKRCIKYMGKIFIQFCLNTWNFTLKTRRYLLIRLSIKKVVEILFL